MQLCFYSKYYSFYISGHIFCYLKYILDIKSTIKFRITYSISNFAYYRTFRSYRNFSITLYNSLSAFAARPFLWDFKKNQTRLLFCCVRGGPQMEWRTKHGFKEIDEYSAQQVVSFNSQEVKWPTFCPELIQLLNLDFSFALFGKLSIWRSQKPEHFAK